MTESLRTAVVGGGLIAQAAHLPNLRRLPGRFRLEALADPSAATREAAAARFGPLRTYADWRELLDAEALDALVVCSPHATHAEVTLAALDRGLHVLVEKPLCITVQDADRIAALARERERVVQVGYMKRFDPAVEALLERLPEEPGGLRFVDVVTYDPWMARAPFFRPDELTAAQDVPAAVLEAGREAERAQVEAAVGAGDPATVRAFSYTYLACLVHDVNLVHGALERLRAPLPATPVTSAHRADGKAASAVLEVADGVRWNCTWLLLDGLEEFQETVSLYFEDAIHTLRFPSPYLGAAPTRYEQVGGQDGTTVRHRRERLHESYMSELEHFHDCIVAGVACRTPPEQARQDLALLRDLFLAASPADD